MGAGEAPLRRFPALPVLKVPGGRGGVPAPPAWPAGPSLVMGKHQRGGGGGSTWGRPEQFPGLAGSCAPGEPSQPQPRPRGGWEGRSLRPRGVGKGGHLPPPRPAPSAAAPRGSGLGRAHSRPHLAGGSGCPHGSARHPGQEDQGQGQPGGVQGWGGCSSGPRGRGRGLWAQGGARPRGLQS